MPVTKKSKKSHSPSKTLQDNNDNDVVHASQHRPVVPPGRHMIAPHGHQRALNTLYRDNRVSKDISPKTPKRSTYDSNSRNGSGRGTLNIGHRSNIMIPQTPATGSSYAHPHVHQGIKGCQGINPKVLEKPIDNLKRSDGFGPSMQHIDHHTNNMIPQPPAPAPNYAIPYMHQGQDVAQHRDQVVPFNSHNPIRPSYPPILNLTGTPQRPHGMRPDVPPQFPVPLGQSNVPHPAHMPQQRVQHPPYVGVGMPSLTGPSGVQHLNAEHPGLGAVINHNGPQHQMGVGHLQAPAPHDIHRGINMPSHPGPNRTQHANTQHLNPGVVISGAEHRHIRGKFPHPVNDGENMPRSPQSTRMMLQVKTGHASMRTVTEGPEHAQMGMGNGFPTVMPPPRPGPHGLSMPPGPEPRGLQHVNEQVPNTDTMVNGPGHHQNIGAPLQPAGPHHHHHNGVNMPPDPKPRPTGHHHRGAMNGVVNDTAHRMRGGPPYPPAPHHPVNDSVNIPIKLEHNALRPNLNPLNWTMNGSGDPQMGVGHPHPNPHPSTAQNMPPPDPRFGFQPPRGQPSGRNGMGMDMGMGMAAFSPAANKMQQPNAEHYNPSAAPVLVGNNKMGVAPPYLYMAQNLPTTDQQFCLQPVVHPHAANTRMGMAANPIGNGMQQPNVPHPPLGNGLRTTQGVPSFDFNVSNLDPPYINQGVFPNQMGEGMGTHNHTQPAPSDVRAPSGPSGAGVFDPKNDGHSRRRLLLPRPTATGTGGGGPSHGTAAGLPPDPKPAAFQNEPEDILSLLFPSDANSNIAQTNTGADLGLGIGPGTFENNGAVRPEDSMHPQPPHTAPDDPNVQKLDDFLETDFANFANDELMRMVDDFEMVQPVAETLKPPQVNNDIPTNVDGNRRETEAAVISTKPRERRREKDRVSHDPNVQQTNAESSRAATSSGKRPRPHQSQIGGKHSNQDGDHKTSEPLVPPWTEDGTESADSFLRRVFAHLNDNHQSQQEREAQLRGVHMSDIQPQMDDGYN
ncbi:hypothetical protein PABG_04205 [Paracoccidioides brasiliensis Pb03]|nr:hypothetical protein PABG_04205 [Paracoccidioides brasiliensis Pb03]